MKEFMFDHRLEEFGFDTRSLCDVIHGIVDRAEAILTMVQIDLVEDGPNFSSEVLYSALESVSCEMADIKDLVEFFHAHQTGGSINVCSKKGGHNVPHKA